jgi:hypothetical protein
MAGDEEREGRRGLRPARPLVGYRDVGEDVRQTRQAAVRTWVLIGVLAAFYLGWTLTVYFLEPGLR